jgi:hypothetical protein
MASMAMSEALNTVVAVANFGHEVAMNSLQELRDKAERYRRMAGTITDPQALEALDELATCYETMAAELDAQGSSCSPDTGLD